MQIFNKNGIAIELYHIKIDHMYFFILHAFLNRATKH